MNDIIAGRIVTVVEDDPKIGSLLIDYLTGAGHQPQLFRLGAPAIEAVRLNPPAAIILDLGLPDMDGLAVCRRIRQFSAAPILMLTAKVEETDRLAGLETGADDYVCKPFSAREVVARVSALIRRSEGRVTTVGRFTIDDTGYRIAWQGFWLTLSRSEFQILAALMRQPGRVFSRAQLLDRLGDDGGEVSDRAIDSHIKNIRRKITAIDPEADPIASVYGVGYHFDA